LELRREIETEFLRQRVTGALDELGATQATRDDIIGRVTQLNHSLQADPTVFTAQLANTGNRVLAAVTELSVAQPEAATSANVQMVRQITQQYIVSGTATSADAELKMYGRTGSASGPKMSNLIGRG